MNNYDLFGLFFAFGIPLIIIVISGIAGIKAQAQRKKDADKEDLP